MNNQQLAADILKEIGGKANIESVTHCVTRLRFVLHDTDIPNKETIASLDGVISVVEQGGQYQIVLGNRVNDVYDTVLQQLGELKDDNTREKTKKSLFDQFTNTISGIFTPALGPMAASGTIKGILTILSVAGILSETSGTYIVLYALSNAFFYFMPILLGASAANYFKLNSYVGMLIGASLIYPTLLPYATEGSLTFFVDSREYDGLYFFRFSGNHCCLGGSQNQWFRSEMAVEGFAIHGTASYRVASFCPPCLAGRWSNYIQLIQSTGNACK